MLYGKDLDACTVAVSFGTSRVLKRMKEKASRWCVPPAEHARRYVQPWKGACWLHTAGVTNISTGGNRMAKVTKYGVKGWVKQKEAPEKLLCDEHGLCRVRRSESLCGLVHRRHPELCLCDRIQLQEEPFRPKKASMPSEVSVAVFDSADGGNADEG